MSGISTGVGLISGINTADLIDQLMQLEARPVTKLQNRITSLSAQKAAWMSLSASLLGLKTAVTGLGQTATFKAAKATSSNTSVLNATASAGASLGTYQFTVRRLVQTHQLISRGFADRDSTPLAAGTITIETGHGRLDVATELDFLNGHAGVGRGSIRITDRAGVTADIDLTDATTVADVLAAINNEASIGVRARVVGDSIVLGDTTGQAGTITVAEVGLGRTAADLGLRGSATDADLIGQDVNTITTDTSLDLLNDGNGVERSDLTDMVITLRDGTVLNVNLYGSVIADGKTIDYTAHTVGDVLDAINTAEGNDGKLIASIRADGKGIQLVDGTAGGDLVVADGAGSHAATQLGLAGTHADGTAEGTRLIAGLNTVMLRNLAGGAGVTLGSLDLQDRSGATASVNLSGVFSVTDVIEAINGAGLNLTAALNAAGNGITITDSTANPTANLVIADNGGDVAAVLGIAVDTAGGSVAGANAQHKYVSGQTRLDDLAPGGPFVRGSFFITNSAGVKTKVTVGSNVTRLADVIELINSRGIGVTARINDSGTGLLLEDTNGGPTALKVTEDGGRVAAQLGILGEAKDDEAFLDGSLRYSIAIEDGDTLDDVVGKINASGAGVTASILNDGSRTNPYRLILSSKATGTAGQIVFDAGATGLGLTTFVEARDALVYIGSPGSPNAVAITSTTNELSGVIQGVTLDLVNASETPVSVTVARDVEGIVAKMQSFVESFNSIVTNIDSYTKYDPETKAKGTLFGDSTVWSIRSRLMSQVIQAVGVSGSYTRIGQVGFSLTSSNQLELDADKLREALTNDSVSIASLFTTKADKDVENSPSGFAEAFDAMLAGFTDSYGGLISNRTGSLDDQTKLLNDRIKSLNSVLASKRERLERQFTAMETALAQLQGQQSSLTALAQMASSFSAKK